MATIDSEWLALVLQTGDPLFPTGAYAHSLGLEEVVRLGLVCDEKSLRQFLVNQVLPALQNFELPLVRFVHEAAIRNNLDEICGIDADMDAWKIARELREASSQMGSRRLQMLLKVASTPLLQNFAQRDSRNHHLVVFGIQMAGVPLDAALTAYLYQSLAAFCSASLKLIRIGQDGCQRVLAGCLGSVSAVVSESKTVSREECGWFNPLLEIASMRHEFAFERLFIS